jgi:UDP-glucose 4-epimerase
MALHLVTGGCGFIGSHLVHALAARGERVRVLDDLSSGRAENLAGLELGRCGSGKPVELLQASVTDATACREATRGAEVVFHEAAVVSVPRSVEDPVGNYDVNVIGALRVLEAARESRARRFVLAASSSAYGDSEELPKSEEMAPNPLSPYASAKLACEHLLSVYARVHGMRTVSLRYFNVFGPRQADDSPYTGVIALFVKALLEGRSPRIYGDGLQTRDFTFVDNVVEANLLAASRDVEPGAVVNVGSGSRTTILDLYREIARLLGSDLRPEHVAQRAGDVRHSQASLRRAAELLGYAPRIDWREGLARTVAWYRARHAARA